VSDEQAKALDSLLDAVDSVLLDATSTNEHVFNPDSYEIPSETLAALRAAYEAYEEVTNGGAR
jgi:hypothetical protein